MASNTGISGIAGIAGIAGITCITGIEGIVNISAQVLRHRFRLPGYNGSEHHRGNTGRHSLHQHETLQDRGALGWGGVRSSHCSV